VVSDSWSVADLRLTITQGVESRKLKVEDSCRLFTFYFELALAIVN
jgi:hypothetical protein